MKTRKKLIVVLALLGVASFVTYGTFARYQSQGSGTGTATIAKWAIEINGTPITDENPIDFTSPITWEPNQNVKTGYLAPGITGTSNIAINPNGTEVGINYWISIDASALTAINENIKVSNVTIGGTCSGGSATGDEATQTECEDIAEATWTPTVLSKIALGTCAGGSATGDEATQTECEAVENATWTASTDPHAGQYAGTIELPTDGEGNRTTMTAAQTVNAAVTIEWEDKNTTPANESDTITGINADGTTKNVLVSVIVEQKIN